jgi:HEAT repeat protein
LRLLAATSSAALLLFLASCQSSAPSASSGAAPASDAPLATLAYDASQQPVADLDREIAAAGQDRAKLNAIATRLIALLRAPDTTFAARQAICQRLAELPPAALATKGARAVFAAMLADEKQINLARLAIERIPGATIDQLFLNALEKSSPATRLALVQSVGNRHLAAATPTLAKHLRDSDQHISAAAAKALSQIATPAALAALRSAPNPAAPAIAEATLTVANQRPAAESLPVFRDLASDTRVPAHLRAAAVRSSLAADPAAAPAQIVAALAGDDIVLKPVVIEAIASLPAPGLVAALAEKLSSFDPPTQVAVIAALGRKGDAAAVPALSAAAKSNHAEIRAAALAALGFLRGDSATARLLGETAAGPDSTDAKLARQSLARLDGPGVADAIIDGAATAATPLRVVYLDQLAARNMTEAVPLLLQTRFDREASVRAAALGALADIAPASAQSSLLAWTLAATEPAEQSRALRALANATLRNPDPTARAQPIVDAIEHADASTAIRLLPVLHRIGGSAAAESAAQLARRDDATVANAAVATLSRWSDGTGLMPLIGVAENAPGDAVRAAAVEAALRFIDRYRDLPSTDLSRSLARLLDATPDDATRLRLVRFLGRCNDDEAIALAQKLQNEPALAAEATDAIAAINANRAGRPAIRAAVGSNQLGNIVDGNPVTRWTTAANPDRWIEIDYKVSRPFHQLTLNQSKWPDNYPERYEVFVTDDPAQRGAALASGAGSAGKTVITLPPGTRGRYLIIANTAERKDGSWSIAELLVD